MARGDMKVESAAFGGGAEILNRPPYEAVAMTIDFTDASGTDFTEDKERGGYYVPAGTPVDKSGKPKKTKFTDVVGIALYDIYPDRPQGAIVTEGYINKDRAEKSSGCEYGSKLVSALVNAGCRIRIEGDGDEDFVIGNLQSGE